MATLERQGYKAYREPDKREYKGGLGNYLGDFSRFAGDSVLSVFGANDVITDESYKTKEFESIAKVTNPLYSVAGKVAADYLAPGIGGTVMGAVQGSVGQMTQSDTPQGYEGYNDIINSLSQIGSQFIGGTPNLPKLAKYGGSMNKKSSYKTGGNLITTSANKKGRGMGLIEFDGPTHENNGIKTSKDVEVEGGEMEITNFNEDGDSYVLSNRLGKGGYKSKKKDQSFADLGKRIKSKYSLRGDTDKLSNLAREKELRKLVEEHERVKEGLGLVDNTQMFFGGGTIESLLGAKNTAGFQLGKSNLDLSLDSLPYPSTATAPALTPQSKNQQGYYGNVDQSSIDTLMSNNPWYDWNNFDANNPESVGAYQKAFNDKAGREVLEVDKKLGPQTIESQIASNPLEFQNFNKFNPFWQAPENLNLSGKKSTTQPPEENYSIAPESGKDTISPFNLDKAKQLGNVATGAQLATAIPGLTTRASDVNYDRVTAPEIDLSAQRRASELSRNRIIASNRAGARGADSVGMALNFLGAVNAGAQGQYGNEVAQSFLSEEQFNKQAQFEASGINANISRAEQEARIAEEDAARSMQLQSLADMAGYIGMGAAGQNQLSMGEGQINMLQNMGDFIYGMDENGNPVIRKKDKVTVSKYGGVIKRNRRK